MIPIPKLELTAASLKLILGIACALALALLIHDRNRWKAKTSRYAELLSAERAANAATIVNVRAAGARARQADLANAERVKARQIAINQRSDHDFQTRLADARAAAGRLRGERPSAAADRRGGGAAPVPGLPAAAGGPHESAGEDRLPQSDKRAGFPAGQLGAGDALIATEQAIQLDELIKWIERQAAVDRGGD